MSGECCADGAAWRAYWTPEAIAERLEHEVALYRRIIAEMRAETYRGLWGEPGSHEIPHVPRPE